MGYEQLSTVIVLIIVLIGVVVWLPIRTSNSMRHVEEHRQDRYSTSLHLVDENSGTRFSDDTTFAKGVQMQPSERRANTLTPERIAEVRRLRHAAVRRRQMIVAALLVITVLVLVLAITLHFSTLFALIPAALTAVVLALGAHAASQARAWEHKVAEARARERKSKAARLKAERAKVEQAAAETARQVAGDNAPTDEMTSLEIRRALRQAQLEQKRALAERARKEAEAQARAAAEAQARAAQAALEAQRTAAAEAAKASVAPVAPAAAAAPVAAATSAAADTVSGASGKQTAAPAEPAASDHTTELAEVHPARAIDAYDMATSQDLISFSLGEARNTAPESETPESREIKSMRQVAKAEPVDAERERELAEEAKIETEPAKSDDRASQGPQDEAGQDKADESVAETMAESAADERRSAGTSAPAQDAGMSDVAAFHESEEQAKVAVPAATSDSLGNNLAAILARRGA